MAHKIVFTGGFTPERIELAKAMLPEGFELQVIDRSASDEEFHAALKEADFLLGIPGRPITREVYAAAPKLKLVQLMSAGYDRMDLEAAREAGVPIANNGGANSTAVAEHALLLRLAMAKKLRLHDANVRAGLWRPPDPAIRPFELEGKTLGVVGLGKIGKKVARRAQAFDMQVQYYDIIRQAEHEDNAMGVSFVSFKELLSTSDIVTLHVSLSERTRGMMNAKAFALMKPTAILINTCRGPVVDEKALYQALVEKKIAGAGIDVFEQEPTPADNPLLKLDQVVVSPHIATGGESTEKALRNAYDNFERVLVGEIPYWIVPELQNTFRLD